MPPELPTMLFMRTYRRLQGGHFKVADYIEHVLRSNLFRPVLYLTPTPMAHEFDRLVSSSVERVQEPFAADAFFVAGTDWDTLDEAGISTEGKLVVNLIQGFAHFRAEGAKRKHLERRALRVCVSEAVRDSVMDFTGSHWPVAVVANGIDWEETRQAARSSGPSTGDVRIFVLGVKDPDLASDVADRLTCCGLKVDLLSARTPREELLKRMAACTVAVLLPKVRVPEGFYLPALEAMVLGRAVVLPDCVGPRSFCIDGETCLVPPRTAKELSEAACTLASDPLLRARFAEAANKIIPRYTLERERMEFTQLLKDYVSGKLGAI
ncbi:MAG: glycosyltransferase family 4 protein [Enhydrobacter sp.]|nr:glycosyltransferase family 4 protein [Enhydrobacter sp.]